MIRPADRPTGRPAKISVVFSLSTFYSNLTNLAQIGAYPRTALRIQGRRRVIILDPVHQKGYSHYTIKVDTAAAAVIIIAVVAVVVLWARLGELAGWGDAERGEDGRANRGLVRRGKG